MKENYLFSLIQDWKVAQGGPIKGTAGSNIQIYKSALNKKKKIIRLSLFMAKSGWHINNKQNVSSVPTTFNTCIKIKFKIKTQKM